MHLKTESRSQSIHPIVAPQIQYCPATPAASSKTAVALQRDGEVGDQGLSSQILFCLLKAQKIIKTERGARGYLFHQYCVIVLEPVFILTVMLFIPLRKVCLCNCWRFLVPSYRGTALSAIGSSKETECTVLASKKISCWVSSKY
jgi:hypothetical protein